MKMSMLENYTNPKSTYNITVGFAKMLASRACTGSKWHWWFRFLPARTTTVGLIKLDPERKDEEELPTDVFMPNGMLYDMPLNYYIEVTLANGLIGKVNAGYLGHRFMMGDRYGYESLKDLTRYIKECATKVDNQQPPSAEEL